MSQDACPSFVADETGKVCAAGAEAAAGGIYGAVCARTRGAGGCGISREAQREYFHRKEDLRFESPDLKEKRESGRRASDLQLTDSRLLVTDRDEDRGYHSSNLNGRQKAGDWFGNSHHEERHASGVSGRRDVMGHERHDIARGSGSCAA